MVDSINPNNIVPSSNMGQPPAMPPSSSDQAKFRSAYEQTSNQWQGAASEQTDTLLNLLSQSLKQKGLPDAYISQTLAQVSNLRQQGTSEADIDKMLSAMISQVNPGYKSAMDQIDKIIKNM